MATDTKSIFARGQPGPPPRSNRRSTMLAAIVGDTINRRRGAA